MNHLFAQILGQCLALFTLYNLAYRLAVDKCLDSGGKSLGWRLCEYEQSGAQIIEFNGIEGIVILTLAIFVGLVGSYLFKQAVKLIRGLSASNKPS